MAAEAAAIASVDGLSGMTLSQLALALGIGKSSVQAAYPTKEDLQLAAVAAASQIFIAAVVAPASAEPAGLPRLRSLVDAWLEYVEQRVFPGGCFMVAALAEYDSRPGPVRDALARARRGWLALLERQVSIAQAAGTLDAALAANALAFEIDALLSAANVARNLIDDDAPLEMARAVIAVRLAPPSGTPRGRARR